MNRTFNKALVGMSTLIFLHLYNLEGFGQKKNVIPCNVIVKKVITPLKPLNFHRKEIHEEDCRFQFVLSDEIQVLLDIEQLTNKKEAKKEIKNRISIFTFADKVTFGKDCCLPKKIKEFWDEGYFFEPKQGKTDSDSGLLLLREKHYLITVIAPSTTLLKSFEYSLKQVLEEEFKKSD